MAIKYNSNFRTLLSTASTSAILLAAAVPMAAYAQDDAEAESANTSGEAIIVTGSRVVRDGYDAPTPLTVVGQELLQAKAPAQIVDALAEMPAFRGTATSSNAGLSNSGTGGQGFVNLRGLGPNRTLVLVDGQRFVPTTSVGTVDVGLIPTLLINRVDVVTGGASAAYGSDAVSGVVNFVLDNRYTGLKAKAEGSITTYGDNESYKLGLAWGAQLGDSGHIVLSGEYSKSDGVFANREDGRQNMLSQWAVVNNTNFTPGTGDFRRYILPYNYVNRLTYGGVIWTQPLRGISFNPDGSLGGFPDNVVIDGGSTFTLDKETRGQPWTYDIAVPVVPVENLSLYGRTSFDLSDTTELYVSGLYAENKPGPFGSAPSQSRITGFFKVARDNAFLPAEAGALMDANSLTQIDVGRYSLDWGPAMISRNNKTYRGVIGLKSEFADGWELDAYAQFGENKSVFLIQNNFLKTELGLAADAVDDGSGNIVCRSTLTNPTNGCVPLNIFGEGNASAAAIDYITGESRADAKYSQQVYAASVSGEPIQLPAGPVSLAFGVEHRDESLTQTVDALSEAFRFHIGNPQPLAGDISVTEGFVETVIPIASGTPGFETLDINGAYRYADYSNSGGVSTWKLGVNWEPVSGLRFRGTRSRDIRAPNITELFTSPIQQTRFVRNPGTGQQDGPQTFTVGNENLKPEVADTTAVGVVLQPDFAPGLQLSVDYYNIKIEDAVTTLAAQDVVDRCFGGNQELCDLITIENNVIVSMDLTYLNLASVKTDGLDFEASYRVPLGAGNLSLRALANRMFSMEFDDGVSSVDRAGDINAGFPEWTANFIASYSTDRFRFDTDVNYVGSGKYDVTFTDPEDINDNTIDSKIFVGAQGTLKFPSTIGKNLEVYLRVSNIFNTQPPGVFQYFSRTNYDRVGRTFKLGARMEF